MNEYSDEMLLDLFDRMLRGFHIDLDEDPDNIVPCTEIYHIRGKAFGNITSDDLIDAIRDMMYMRASLEEELG